MGKVRNIAHADVLISRMYLGKDPIALTGAAVEMGEKAVRFICFEPENESLDAIEDDIPLDRVRGICALREGGRTTTYFCVLHAYTRIPVGEPGIIELMLELDPVKR